MAISFAFKNNVQVLKFSELLSHEESTQVLMKLEEKVKQGRKLFLFHLEQFQNQDEASKTKIIHLIKFCIQQNLNVALCLPQKSWSIYSAGSLALAKMFNTEAEGLLYLETLSARTEDKPLTVDESKKKDTDELLKKYEIFHKPDELDPYHLKNMDKIYSFTPTIEAIESLEKASIDIAKRKENISRLEVQCEQISRQALEMSSARNQAIKENEFSLRQKQISAREAELISTQKTLSQKVLDLQKEIEEVRAAIGKTAMR